MRSILRLLLPGLLACALAGQASAYLRYESAPAESRWIVESGALACHLTHPLPHFGVAVFSRTSNGEHALRVYLHRPPESRHEARLASLPTQWQYGVEQPIGTTEILPRQEALVLGHRMANALLQELEAGHRIALLYDDWYQESVPGSAALTPVGFRPAYRDYLACITGLQERRFEHRSGGTDAPDRTTEEHRDTVRTDAGTGPGPLERTLRGHGIAAPEKPVESPRLVYFVFDNSELTYSERQRLRRFADEILTDPSDPTVIITGHTDSRGDVDYNEALGKRRASAVREYLEELGLPARRIVHETRGEHQPVASNERDDGRAENRRAVLEVHRR